MKNHQFWLNIIPLFRHDYPKYVYVCLNEKHKTILIFLWFAYVMIVCHSTKKLQSNSNKKKYKFLKRKWWKYFLKSRHSSRSILLTLMPKRILGSIFLHEWTHKQPNFYSLSFPSSLWSSHKNFKENKLPYIFNMNI